MTIDLTPAELREFAEFFSRWGDDWHSLSAKEFASMDSYQDRIAPGKRTPLIAASLALALADAMEERDRLRADLEAARVQYNELLYAVGQREPGKSRHEAALELIRRGQRSDNEAAKENPAVRAAREGR